MTLPATEQQIKDANSGGKTPVVFIHGLWLHPSSWDPWGTVFSAAGYAPVAVDWPGDPATVQEAKANPDAFKGQTVGKVGDHVADLTASSRRSP